MVYGSDDDSDESWEESETRVQNYTHEHLNIDEYFIKIERAYHIRGGGGKNSPRPIIMNSCTIKIEKMLSKLDVKNAKTL